VPTPIPHVIPTVIFRVGEPANMLIMLVGVIPVGVVVSDRRGCPIGIPLMHPPAFAVLIAGDVRACGGLGVGDGGHHQGYARNGEK